MSDDQPSDLDSKRFYVNPETKIMECWERGDGGIWKQKQPQGSKDIPPPETKPSKRHTIYTSIRGLTTTGGDQCGMQNQGEANYFIPGSTTAAELKLGAGTQGRLKPFARTSKTAARTRFVEQQTAAARIADACWQVEPEDDNGSTGHQDTAAPPTSAVNTRKPPRKQYVNGIEVTSICAGRVFGPGSQPDFDNKTVFSEVDWPSGTAMYFCKQDDLERLATSKPVSCKAIESD
jgi:hypothetical protein